MASRQVFQSLRERSFTAQIPASGTYYVPSGAEYYFVTLRGLYGPALLLSSTGTDAEQVPLNQEFRAYPGQRIAALGGGLTVALRGVSSGGFVDAAGQPISVSDGYKSAALLGDSLTAQHEAPTGGVPAVGAQGFWNWANWLIGAPFEFELNLGVSGARTVDIFSRIYMIPPAIDTVFVCAGDNDVEAVSGSANQSAIDAAVDALIGTNGDLAVGLAKLREAGKNIAIATIPPRNTWVAGDSRVQVLDRVNAWIKTVAPLTGLVDEVMDLFAPLWDSTQPTARVFKTGYAVADGTHLTNLAGYAAGATFISGMQRMYRITRRESRAMDNLQNQAAPYGAMRVISGVSSTISTGGTGTAATDMAGGWRSLRSGGAATWACSIEDYVPNPNYVGPMAQVGHGEKFQRLDVVGTAAADICRIQFASSLAANSSPGISFGDEFRVAAEVWVENPVSVNGVYVQGVTFLAAGTTPADQPYGTSTTQARTTANISATGGTDVAYTSGFRAVLRSRSVRVPENVNGTTAASALMYMDTLFNAAGSARMRWARPQFWRKF